MQIRKGKYFSGGIHPADKKEMTRDNPIVKINASEIVAISLSQHIGKPAIPVVQTGDVVMRGALIAKADGLISANVHSSVSGKVVGIEKRPAMNGTLHECIVITNDRQDAFLPMLPLNEITPETILERIREAGIVGMGGAGFPTAVKLSPKTPVDTLLINAAECEPYLTCDFRLMVEKTEEVAEGIRFMAQALKVKRIVIGIEKNKPEAIEKFAKFDDFEVVILQKRYPMGSEKHLIYSCIGRKVPPAKLPSDVHCVVQNVSTALAVYDACVRNKPLIDRIMTISGNAVVHGKNFKVPIGTRIDEIITECGGARENAEMICAGGPMMGPALLSTDYYTKKTDGGLLLLDKKEVCLENPTSCISCGKCAKACPMRLLPMQIEFYTLAGDYEKAADIGGVKDCIMCGSCSFVCPAKRALIQSITLCKQKIAKK